MDGSPEELLVELHFVVGDVGEFGDVVAAAESDVGVHLFHAMAFDVGEEGHVVFGRLVDQGAHDLVVFDGDEGESACCCGCLDDGVGHGVGDVDGFDEDFFTGFEFRGVVD